MDIVLDTSVLIAVVANESSRDRALTVTKGMRLVAPASVHWEIGNALSAMLKRRRIASRQAEDCLDAYLGIPLTLVDVDMNRALHLADMLGIYAYDAYLLACAEQLHVPLLTLDKALRDAAKVIGISAPEI